MNSVMGIGDHILFLADGKLSWEGKKEDILNTDNETLNSFLFSSDLVKKVKEMANK
jgi:phospholipid/cholesterol/gamma-HCH transport system ATP-binding protein